MFCNFIYPTNEPTSQTFKKGERQGGEEEWGVRRGTRLPEDPLLAECVNVSQLFPGPALLKRALGSVFRPKEPE